MRQTKDKRTDSLKRRKFQTTQSFAALDTKFAVQELPSEIIHLICKYLVPTDVANLRLVSQKVAQIGLEYLVPCIHLQLTTASYNRLSAISRHPVISKHVYGIRYDSDFLKPISWEEFKHWRVTRSRGLCTRAQLKSEKEIEKSEMEKIQAAYRLHQDFLKNQSELQQQAFLSSHVTEAILRLPNLIRLDSGELSNHERFLKLLEAIFGRNTKSITPHKGGWYWPSGYSYDGRNQGFSAPITATLLYGLGSANSNIEQIVIRFLHWRVLRQTDSDFAIMKDIIRKIHRMKISFDGRKLLQEEIEGPEFEECLTKWRPFELLTCCCDLTHLDLTWYEYLLDDKFDLQHFLGDFTWHLLSSVRLGNFRITEMALVNFAARHSTSLDELSLWDITLSEGAWYSTFRSMRKVLRLKKASVEGIFYYYNDEEAWWMDPNPKQKPPKQAYGDYVREYLEDHSDREMQLDVLVRDGHV